MSDPNLILKDTGSVEQTNRLVCTPLEIEMSPPKPFPCFLTKTQFIDKLLPIDSQF